MSLSTRQYILNELLARLSEIRVVNGYQTDAGAAIFIGEEPVLGPADPEQSIAVVVAEDEPGYQGEDVTTVLPVDVQAIVKAGTVGASASIEKIIADIKTAVEKDHDFGRRLIYRGLVRGKTRPLDRESGSQFVGTAVEYRLTFKEKWGQP